MRELLEAKKQTCGAVSSENRDMQHDDEYISP